MLQLVKSFQKGYIPEKYSTAKNSTTLLFGYDH